MRLALSIALLALAACGSTSNGHDALVPDAQADRCVSACVQSRQMEARGIDEIEADCRKECAAKK